MDAETATNPPADSPAPAEVVTEQVEATETPETEPQAQPIVEEEEVEYEGQKFKLPKPLKSALMMQADYTRKTQELAEQRKALDTERVQHATTQREHLKELGKLAMLDEQLEQYAKFNWSAAYAQDAAKAAEWNTQWNVLREHRTQLAQKIDGRENERTTLTQQETAKRHQDMDTYLAKEFNGKEFPLYTTDLDVKYGNLASSVGLAPKQFAQLALSNPSLLKLVHLAHVGQELIAKQRKAAAPAPAEPVPQVGASRSPSTNPLTDRAKIDDWMKARNKQVKR